MDSRYIAEKLNLEIKLLFYGCKNLDIILLLSIYILRFYSDSVRNLPSNIIFHNNRQYFFFHPFETINGSNGANKL